ncbi:amidase [Kocuria tytonicola]|uniref:Amidase n=1 Tax=Kocuria tytonicola TaxID=2055946 RepID=A0A3L9L4B2_9MICC|nr:amidase [Kocuria tytonicola]RLY93813.1 amidase [Kocuria tytonicola]
MSANTSDSIARELQAAPLETQVRAVHERAVTVSDLVRATRAAIRDHESALHAWVALSPDLEAEAASVGTDPGTHPMAGVSVGVKDLIDVAGLPTRAGSPTTSPDPAPEDAPCVSRLRKLGAVVQGKTITTEFGYFTPGPTTNPHAADHTPGGSSSGSAAAVGAGTIGLALGTQTAGSLTRPASYCGAAGMVLAHGAVDLKGVTGLSPSLDSLGMLTRTVEDLRWAHAAFCGPTARGAAEAAPPGRALLWDGSHLDTLDPAMTALLRRLPALLGRLDQDVAVLQWDDHVQSLAQDHATVMAHEAARSLEQEWERCRQDLGASLRKLLEQGREIPEAECTAALIRRDRSRQLLEEILTPPSYIVGPAALGPAPAGLAATGSPVLSRPWQLLGLPVVVVPGARTSSGLPLGVQVVGRPGREGQLLDIAHGLEHLLRQQPSIPD